MLAFDKKMKEKKLFFTEFMFSGYKEKSSNYYFPVLIGAETADIAGDISKKIVKMLQLEFNKIKVLPLQIYQDPLLSETLSSFAEHGYQAEIYKLDLRSLTLTSLESQRVKLSKPIYIVPQNLQEIYTHTLHYQLERSSLLTTQVHKERDFQKEFLILKMYKLQQ